jgi:hypothetical protein
MGLSLGRWFNRYCSSDVVELCDADWEHVLYIGLADGRKVDAGPEYARGLRVIDKLRDVGEQVPGLKQVVQVGGRACEIDIDPMDVPQRKRK